MLIGIRKRLVGIRKRLIGIRKRLIGIRKRLIGIRKMFLGIRRMFLGIQRNIEAGMQENMVLKNMVDDGVCGDALGHAHHVFKNPL